MSNASARYRGVAVAFEDGDQETIDSFFERRNRKKARFYRDAIIEKIAREEAIEREREAIAAGRTQVDPSLAGTPDVH